MKKPKGRLWQIVALALAGVLSLVILKMVKIDDTQVQTKGGGIVLPTVTTQAASSITQTEATLNGNIADTGGQDATQYGFKWGTVRTLSGGDTATTTTLGTHGIGVFTDSRAALLPGTTYFVRAYASNSAGTGLGAIVSFTTLSTHAP
ncbi:MAG TPA: hypothetical protein VK675_04700 [Candidatus Paceibacterota bacterium]|nr:hypothetical protein [Candidatus Paceibacterota bacterium]